MPASIFPAIAAFLAANPGWPSLGFLRRRAEAVLWQEKADAATVRAFFAKEPPTTAKGQFALARALLAQGDRAGAQALVREAWRNGAFGNELETRSLEIFQGPDHGRPTTRRAWTCASTPKTSMAALRAAHRVGGYAPEIAKARAAVIKKAANAKALLDAVPHGCASAMSATSSAARSGCGAPTSGRSGRV